MLPERATEFKAKDITLYPRCELEESNLVQNNCHKPFVLFNVLNRLINPPEHTGIIPSALLCDRFCKFFTDKVSSIRAVTHCVVPDPSIIPLCTAVFEDFVPLSFSDLSKTVQGLRHSVCSLDSLPAKLFKDVFDTIGPFILNLINMSLSAPP